MVINKLNIISYNIVNYDYLSEFEYNNDVLIIDPPPWGNDPRGPSTPLDHPKPLATSESDPDLSLHPRLPSQPGRYPPVPFPPVTRKHPVDLWTVSDSGPCDDRDQEGVPEEGGRERETDRSPLTAMRHPHYSAERVRGTWGQYEAHASCYDHRSRLQTLKSRG